MKNKYILINIIMNASFVKINSLENMIKTYTRKVVTQAIKMSFTGKMKTLTKKNLKF